MTRFEKQINFIKEIDKLKTIKRRALLLDGSRFENSAEHSWHLAMLVMVLQEYCIHSDQKLDLLKIIKMALIHDIVEIDAGDTYPFASQETKTQKEREYQALERIFSLLPSDQASDLKNTWIEFETGATLEAHFARALDRLNPFLLNYYNNGKSWQMHKVTKSQMEKRMGEIKHSSPFIWDFVSSLINDAVEKQYLIDDAPKKHEPID